MTEQFPRSLLKTEVGQAAVANAWVGGLKQRDIARAFDIKGPALICLAILRLIQKYCPEDCRSAFRLHDGSRVPKQGKMRKAIAHKAAARYLKSHSDGRRPRI